MIHICLMFIYKSMVSYVNNFTYETHTITILNILNLTHITGKYK